MINKDKIKECIELIESMNQQEIDILSRVLSFKSSRRKRVLERLKEWDWKQISQPTPLIKSKNPPLFGPPRGALIPINFDIGNL